MSFKEEIKPYVKAIKLAQQGKGNITNITTIRDIRDIYDKYIKDKRITQITDVSCGNCVRVMINQLTGAINRITPETDGKKFKFPSDKKMKWGAFKKYCKSKGLNVTGKTREQLEKELNG